MALLPMCQCVYFFKRYKKGQFCCYCEQIYHETDFNADVDGKDWIGCDLCDRWVHIDCEEKHGNHSIKYL